MRIDVVVVVLDPLDLVLLFLDGGLDVFVDTVDLILVIGFDGFDLLETFVGGVVDSFDGFVSLPLEVFDLFSSFVLYPFYLFFVSSASGIDSVTFEVDGSGSDLVKTDDASSGRGLSASGFSDETEAFSLVDVKGDVMYGFELVSVSHREKHLQMADGKNGVRKGEIFLERDAVFVDLFFETVGQQIAERVFIYFLAHKLTPAFASSKLTPALSREILILWVTILGGSVLGALLSRSHVEA